MNIINHASMKKTLYYLRRNGMKNTCCAVLERLEERKKPQYRWVPPTPEELARQRRECGLLTEAAVTFSIVVPCYRTGKRYLLEMIDSVRSQTYPRWELILADATEDDSVGRVARAVKDDRIRYIKLGKNGGIAENTNRGIELAVGDYVGLLDHDDLLTEDALYEMWRDIEDGISRGVDPKLLYSDEDKFSGDADREYYELNKKEDFNLDLLLSNNYICHFMVMEKELIQALLMRGEYDGSQDYDLTLRAAEKLTGREEKIIHVQKVLYHWRCHASSTAENPQSKRYAYEAGRRAVQDFADRQGWRVKAVDTPHLGFYRLKYRHNPFEARRDVGVVGGPLFSRGWTTLHFRFHDKAIYLTRKPLFRRSRIVGGRLKGDGTVYYEGLPKGYSGYLHRAALSQDAEAVDIRNIRVRKELWPLFRDIVGVPWRTVSGKEIFDVSTLPKGTDIKAVSIAFGRAVRDAGYRILYLPECARELGMTRRGKTRKNGKSNGCYTQL